MTRVGETDFSERPVMNDIIDNVLNVATYVSKISSRVNETVSVKVRYIVFKDIMLGELDD